MLGPHYVETPLLETGFIMVWEGHWKVAPYSDFIGYKYDGELKARGGGPLILSLNKAVTMLGRSAPVNPAHVAEAAPEPLPAEGPSGDYLAGQSAVRQAALSTGFVYKNDAYWADFQSYEVRRIFEGHHQYNAVGGLALPAVLLRYLALNSEACASTIEDPQTFKLEEHHPPFRRIQSTGRHLA